MFPLPTHISRYEIKGLIGRGGMGDLYLARDTNPNTNRLVAIKLLNASLDSGDLRERFARESRALAALNHPNIVNIYDSGEFEDSPFIVMEYVRGETLAEKIKRRAQLSTAQKLRLMEELCAGLAHAHEAGIIHRDIKPANLMVHQSGRLKILDFGIARVAEGSFTRAGLEMTQVNVRIGTPGFMSPEQIEGGPLDHRSDLFAVGAVCYELLSYQEAFSGANTRQVEHKVLQGQPAPLAPLVEGLDPELVAIINRALEKDPARRYQNAATLEAAIEHQRMRLGAAATPPPPDRTTPVPAQSQGVRPRGQRAEAAYERALAVYNEGAHEAARRFVLETLAEDPDHKDARALLERLEPRKRWTPPRPPPPARAAKPPAAVPPTSINTRAASSDEDSSSDLTIRVPNPRKVPVAVASTDATLRPQKKIPIASTDATLRPQKKAPIIASMEETMRPRARAAAPPPPPPPPPARPRAPSRPPSPPVDYRALWIRHGRTVQIAGAVVAAIAVLIGGFYLFGGFGPQRLLLTIKKPTGGTIVTKGIRCGTDGSNCSASIVNGDPVELEVRPDKDFVFAGYTGDCAPAGRTLMLAARTCGATFSPVTGQLGGSGSEGGGGGGAGLTQLLTITLPQGGTILSAGIECGTMGADCSEPVPNGLPVRLRPLADTGFTFQRYTGDCFPSGESLMSMPRTCGAVFVPNQVAQAPTATGPVVRVPPRQGGSNKAPAAPAAPELPAPIPSDPRPAGGPGGGAAGAPGAVTPGQTGPAPPPISPEEHAKKEINRLLKDYCAAFEHLDLTAMRKVFPAAPAQMNDQFRQFKAVQCAVAGEPEFVKLDAEGGTAQIEVPTKMVYDQKVGGVQKLDLLTTAKFSRPEARDSWRIDSISHKPKPK
jgi:serine/threonine protein kinase